MPRATIPRWKMSMTGCVQPSVRGRGRTIGAIAAAACATAMFAGCTQQEVTYTVGGEEVDPNPPSGPASDVDPCATLTEPTTDLLGLTDIEPVEMSYTPDGGCTWDGQNHYVRPTLTLWVDGPTEASATDEIVDVAGVPVNVYVIGPTSGRLIAYFDDLTLSVNYNKAKVEIDTYEALELAMTDILAAYSRS